MTFIRQFEAAMPDRHDAWMHSRLPQNMFYNTFVNYFWIFKNNLFIFANTIYNNGNLYVIGTDL